MPTPFSLPMTPPGYQNIYIPGYMGDKSAHEKFLVGFTLNEDMIALNQWLTVVGTDSPRAYYPIFNSSDFVRLKNNTGRDRHWQDGTERPTAMQGPRFTNREFRLERYGESTFIGNMAEEYSQLGSLITLNQEQLASRALVWRSVVAASVITDPSKYITTGSPAPTDTYFASWAAMKTALEGGGGPYPSGYFGANLYAGTINAPVAKRFFGWAVQEVQRRTNGRVKIKDLLFLINPRTAAKLAATEEVHAYLAQQVNSQKLLEGSDPAFDNAAYGIPQPFYNIRVVCDATAVAFGAPIDSPTDADYGMQSYVIPDDFIAVATRPGSVAGMANSASFSSVVLFQNKERALKPSTFPDVRSERVEVAMEDMFTVDLVAPDCTIAIGDAAT